MDTIEDLFRILKEEELEALNAALVAGLIEQMVLRKFRFLGKLYIIAIDGTGIASFDYAHCEACLKKASKNGKIIYLHNVINLFLKHVRYNQKYLN